MRGPAEFIRIVLGSVLNMPDAVTRVGSALWLYVLLALKAGEQGRVIRTTSHLAEDLSVDEDTIKNWLDRLRKVDLLIIQSPPPYLVTKLRFWPSEPDKTAPTEPIDSGGKPARHNRVPVGSKAAAAAASKQSEDGGAGEGETLLDEALTALGGSDRAEIERLLARYPEEVARRALIRVRNTPESRIRKSREALFRYLLTRFSQDTK